MGKKRQSRKTYGKETHYWRSEMKPLLVAAACIDIAIEHSQEANRIYQQIIDEWGKPDCQALLKDDIAIPSAEFEAWLKAAIEGNDYNSGLDIWRNLYEKYSKSDDSKELFGLMSEFIRVGFNRKEDLDKGKIAVMAAHSAYLWLAVVIWTAGSYIANNPDWDGETQLKIGDRIIDVSALEGVSSERVHRRHSKEFKKLGFGLSHDGKLRHIAWYWYQCRVVYSSTEEFCRAHLLETGIELHPANISKEIRLGDIATGYPRKNLPKQSLQL